MIRQLSTLTIACSFALGCAASPRAASQAASPAPVAVSRTAVTSAPAPAVSPAKEDELLDPDDLAFWMPSIMEQAQERADREAQSREEAAKKRASTTGK